jgi:hypothetical protein
MQMVALVPLAAALAQFALIELLLYMAMIVRAALVTMDSR